MNTLSNRFYEKITSIYLTYDHEEANIYLSRQLCFVHLLGVLIFVLGILVFLFFKFLIKMPELIEKSLLGPIVIFGLGLIMIPLGIDILVNQKCIVNLFDETATSYFEHSTSILAKSQGILFLLIGGLVMVASIFSFISLL